MQLYDKNILAAQDMWSLTGRASETNIRYEQTMQELEVGLYTFGPIGPFVEVCDADWKPSPGEGGLYSSPMSSAKIHLGA